MVVWSVVVGSAWSAEEPVWLPLARPGAGGRQGGAASRFRLDLDGAAGRCMTTVRAGWHDDQLSAEYMYL